MEQKKITEETKLPDLDVKGKILGIEKAVLGFGLFCYNKGLDDGRLNPKGGQSIKSMFDEYLEYL